jgi:hypothetical protein
MAGDELEHLIIYGIGVIQVKDVDGPVMSGPIQS